MTTYASEQDVINYIEGWVTADPFALERLLQKAEHDVDKLVKGFHPGDLPPTVVVSIPAIAGGTFIPSFGGYAGTPVNYNDTGSGFASSLQSIINATIGVTGSVVRVTGHNPWTIIWDLTFARDHYPGFVMPAVTIDGSGLSPASPALSVVLVRGRKLDPVADLTANQALSLARATCGQFEYRNAMGADFFVRPQYSTVKGPDFMTQGKLPNAAPKVITELTQSGLLLSQGRAVAGRRRGVVRGWPTY